MKNDRIQGGRAAGGAGPERRGGPGAGLRESRLSTCMYMCVYIYIYIFLV